MKEERRGEGIVKGLKDNIDEDGIGMKIMIEGEMGKEKIEEDLRLEEWGFIVKKLGWKKNGNGGLGLILMEKNEVIGDEMENLMGNKGRKLRGIIGKREKEESYIEIKEGEGEGIDVGWIKNGDEIGMVRIVGKGCKIEEDIWENEIKIGVIVLEEIGGEDKRMMMWEDMGKNVVEGEIIESERIGGRMKKKIIDRIDRMEEGNKGKRKKENEDGSFKKIVMCKWWNINCEKKGEKDKGRLKEKYFKIDNE